MTGTKLISRPSLTTAPWIAAILLLVVLGFAVVLITEEGVWQGMLILAIWPLCMLLAFLYFRERGFEAELQQDGISVQGQISTFIPFADLEAVQVEKPGKALSSVHILHRQGILSIPEQKQVNAEELVAFLSPHLSEHAFDKASSEIQQVAKRYADKFGEDKVFLYLPRMRTARKTQGKGWRAFLIASIVTGAIWMTIGILANSFWPREYHGWFGGGMVLLLFSSLFWILSSSRSELRGGKPKWHRSGLIISPIGLAMIQGKLRGEMKWSELKRTVFPSKRRSFQAMEDTRTGSILLDFSGGDAVEIFDIYSHTLSHIHSRIQHYWKMK